MAYEHSHDHRTSGNIKVVFFLNLGFTLIEIVGGIWTNSLAILSDALHDFGDSLSWYKTGATRTAIAGFPFWLR